MSWVAIARAAPWRAKKSSPGGSIQKNHTITPELGGGRREIWWLFDLKLSEQLRTLPYRDASTTK